MATMKMSGCLALVARMPQSDQDALLARVDQYKADGIPAERAQVMAANDLLEEIRAERTQLMSAIAEQHPDLLTVTQGQAAATDPSAADEALSFSRRRKPDPEKTVTAYKLFRVNEKKPGQLFPLFIGKNDPVEMGVWFDADDIPTKGFSARPGWHAGEAPVATHIGVKSRPGLKAPDVRPDNQVWAEIQMSADVDWQPEANRRGTNAKGKVVAGKADIKDQIPEDGFYRYKTNPNMTGTWMIGGSIKVVRVLSDAEVKAINDAAGVADLPRQEPFDAERFGFKLGRQRGINVRNDGDNRYADLIVDGDKTMESRDSNSLRPYVGQTVGIIRTGEGPAKLIGSVKIGEPIEVDEQQFRELESEHLVPKGSAFDIKPGRTKFLYPLSDARRFDDERDVESRGIVARDVQFSRSRQTDTPEFKRWFGDSKAVDENGQPLVVYHGTPTGGFTVFDTGRLGSKGGYARGGFSFTTDYDAADSYANGFSEEANEIDAKVAKANAVFAKIPAEKMSEDLASRIGGEEGLPPEWSWMAVDAEDDLASDMLSVASELEAEGMSDLAREMREAAESSFTASPQVMEVYLKVPPSAPEFDATPETLGQVVASLDVRTIPERAAVVNLSNGERIFYVADPEQIKSATGNSGAFDPANPDITKSAKRRTDTPEFKRWFGDSAVVDKSGKPLVVYHGNPTQEFDGELFADGRMAYFSNKPSVAEGYTSSRNPWLSRPTGAVYPAYLSISNPLVIDAAGKRFNNIPVPWQKWKPTVFGNLPGDAVSVTAAAEYAKANGHDGLIVRNVLDAVGRDERLKSDVYVAFRREQVKSATGNNGDFDPANPDITKSARRNLIAERDEVGRVQFGAGAVAYDLAATVANNVLDRLAMKPISKDLGRAMRKMKLEVERAQNLAVDVAAKLKDLPEDERQMISDVIEGELKAGVTPPRHVLDLAASMQSIMSEQSAELVRLGMLSPEAAGRWDGKYLPRFYESKLGDETRQWARAAASLFRKQKTMQGIKGDSLKSRGMFKTVPVEELDQWTGLGWEVRDEGYRPGRDQTVQVWRDFTRDERENMGEIRDAMFRFVMGYTRTQRDAALGRLYENLASSVASRTAQDGFVKVPDTKVDDTQAKRYGALAGMYVPREVLDHLSAYDDSMQNDLLRIYRKGLSMWKEGKTVLNPVSHANNVISNLTMAHFAGVSYWDVGKYAGTVRDLVRGGPMVAEAKAAGLFGATFNRGELLNNMPEQLKALAQMSESRLTRGVDSVWNALSFWLRKPMGRAYEAEDQFFRYLIYRDARGRGMNADDAVDYSQQFIFAYDDLPKGARFVRDAGIPFFAYTYKVVPVLAATALKHPWRFAAPAAVLYGVNAMMYAMAFALQNGDDDDWWEIMRRYATDENFRKQVSELEAEERENLPPWMKGSSALGTPKAIRLGVDAMTNLPVFLDVSRIVPGGDLLDADNNSGGLGVLQPLMPSSPVLTTLSAILVNRDMFTGRDVVNKLTDTSAEAAAKRGTWLWKQFSPAIAVGNYHFDRAINALANVAGQPIAGYTGTGRDGLPVQPGYAAMQAAGIKARPIDLETSGQIREGQKKQILRELDLEIRRIDRLEQKGAITAENAEAQREQQRVKRDRVREGLTVEGEPVR